MLTGLVVRAETNMNELSHDKANSHTFQHSAVEAFFTFLCPVIGNQLGGQRQTEYKATCRASERLGAARSWTKLSHISTGSNTDEPGNTARWTVG
jgi:hypothetical protein